MKTNKSTLKVAFLILAFPFLIISCSNNSKYEGASDILIEATGENESYQTVSTTPQSEDEAPPLQDNVKIIRNATMRMKVDEVEHATRLARNYAVQYAGYISDERMENNVYAKENRFTVRVPQKYFDVVMDSISSLSNQIDSKNVSTIDVTEEYVDLQSRLATKREVKERYESILRSRARTVEEVLNAEEKIRILQEEIEVAEGRLRYLTSNISYSTIQIDMYEVLPEIEVEVEEESYWEQFFGDVKGGLRFGSYIVEIIVIGIIHIWPLVIGGVIVIVILRRRRKRRSKK